MRGQPSKPKPSYQPSKPTPQTTGNNKECSCHHVTPKPCSANPQNIPESTTTLTTILPTSTPHPVQEIMPSQIDQIVSIWAGSLNNVTEEKIQLMLQVDRLSAENQFLVSIIKNMNSSNLNKLIVGGKIPKGGDAEDFVRSLLREKLMVKDRFESAVRNDDGTITITMENFDGKLNVLVVAKEKLKHSQIVILDAIISSSRELALKTGEFTFDDKE